MLVAQPFLNRKENKVMKREEIIKRLQENDSTVLSFPDRGDWGAKNYRGNCSGWYLCYLIWKYKVTKLAELFAGSGTGSDAARDMGISYIGADLNPTPARPNILTVNAVTDDVPEEFYGADMIFMHPPYGKEINISYAGNMYADPTGELSKYDLGQMPWEHFIKTLNEIIMKYYAAMDKGATMTILMGDVRRNNKFYSMLTDIVKPGSLEQIIIKTQHNCVSNGRTYSNRNFVPIVHEYLMVLKKLSPYIIDFQLSQKYELDIRDSVSATWKDVVYAVLKKIGRKATLEEIYKEIESYKKCSSNQFWQAKVRQTLQTGNMFVHVSTGVWTIAA